MSDYGTQPASSEIDVFVQRLRRRRTALQEFVEGDDAAELARAVDEIGEDLLVADEELRAQAGQLEQSTRRLDALVAAYEDLFADAPIPYVHTDLDGLVLRVNRAAAELLGLTGGGGRSRTLAGSLATEHRLAVRQVLSRLRAAAGRSTARVHEPVEAAVLRKDGRELPVLISARLTRAVATESPTVHWEIRERAPSYRSPEEPPAPRETGATAALESLAAATLAVAAHGDPDAELREVATRARALVPAAAGVSVALVRRGQLISRHTTGEVPDLADAEQFGLDEGPAATAFGSGEAVLVPDLARENRWPGFTRSAGASGFGSVLAVPLVGPRGRVGTATFYARGANAFSEDEVAIASAFGVQVGVVHTGLEVQRNLHLALTTREAVGQAVGILMERYRLKPMVAFDRLVGASQRSHRKLRDIAIRLVETGEDPESVKPW